MCLVGITRCVHRVSVKQRGPCAHQTLLGSYQRLCKCCGPGQAGQEGCALLEGMSPRLCKAAAGDRGDTCDQHSAPYSGCPPQALLLISPISAALPPPLSQIVPKGPVPHSPLTSLSPCPSTPHTLGPASAAVSFKFCHCTPTPVPATSKPGESLTGWCHSSQREPAEEIPASPFKLPLFPAEFSLTKGTIPPLPVSTADCNSCKEMIRAGLTQH